MTSPRRRRSRSECARGDSPDAIASLRGKDRDIHALVVLRHCKAVAKLYAENVTRDHNHALYSATKSVLATLARHAVEKRKTVVAGPARGRYRCRERVRLMRTNWKRHGGFRIRHVMSMASGLEHRSDPASHPIYGAADRFQFALAPALLHAPGQRFNYSNGDASIAGAVVAAAAGKDLLGYGNEFVWAARLQECRMVVPRQSRQVSGRMGPATARRRHGEVGQLYLQNGRWQDRTIIDAGFVRDAWRRSPAASHYGLFWWRWPREDPRIGPVHFADGFKGQRIYVLPKHGIIIVVSANISAADADKAYPALVRAVVSAVQSDRPIDRSTTDANRLAEQLRLPFSGKPGNPVSPTGQDVPRLPK